MQDIITINNYADFEQKFDNVMQETAERFVVIGYLLKVARDTDILRESGYSTMGEFAQKRYGLTKDVASRYIAINDRYSEGGYSEQLDLKYKAFGYTKLAEMLTLPDTIVGEISPDMTKAEIRVIAEEVREEKNISDIEVLIEEMDKKVETLDTLPAKVLCQICRENPDIFKKLWVAAEEQMDIEKLQNILVPSGMAMISCRIPGTGRLILSAKDDEENLQIINIRNNEKEEISWEEFVSVAVKFMFIGENYKVAYKEIYGEEFPEEKTEVAPAQPKAERVVKAKKPEKSKKTPKKEEKKAEPVAVQEEQLPGQMEVTDYPELLQEGEKDGIHRTTDDDGRTSNSGNIECDEEERGASAEPGTPSNEPEAAQSDAEGSEEKCKENQRVTHSIKDIEEEIISENETIRRMFTVFSRGKMPIGELELAKEHAQKMLANIEEVIRIKKGE